MAYVLAGFALVLLSYLLSRLTSWVLGRRRRPVGAAAATDDAGSVDRLAVASIVIAILSCLGCIFPAGTLAGAVVALTLGLVAQRRASAGNVRLATTAVVLAGLVIVFGLFAYAFAMELSEGPL